MPRPPFPALLLLLGLLCPGPLAYAQRPAKPGNLTTYFNGSLIDSPASPAGGPALLLMGGGAEVDLAFTSRAYPILKGGDIVVLRATGSNGYQSYFFTTLPGKLPAADRTRLQPNSVETLLVTSRAKADLDYVRYALDHAEMIWMAGGNQSDYTTNWRGTAVETVLRAAYARGAVIGGTSAGAQVLGEYIYDPVDVTAVTSAEAVANPYRANVLVSTDFLRLPPLYDTLVDAHFANRDRMGRLLAFMARLRQDARTSVITGVGIDENTALWITPAGLATALVDGGPGLAYILREDRLDTVRTQVSAGLPLIYARVRRTRLSPGQTYDLSTGATTGVTTLLSVAGAVPANPY